MWQLQTDLQAAPRRERMEELDKDLKELRAENQQKMEQLRRYSFMSDSLLLFGLVSAIESTLAQLLPLP